MPLGPSEDLDKSHLGTLWGWTESYLEEVETMSEQIFKELNIQSRGNVKLKLRASDALALRNYRVGTPEEER